MNRSRHPVDLFEALVRGHRVPGFGQENRHRLANRPETHHRHVHRALHARRLDQTDEIIKSEKSVRRWVRIAGRSASGCSDRREQREHARYPEHPGASLARYAAPRCPGGAEVHRVAGGRRGHPRPRRAVIARHRLQRHRGPSARSRAPTPRASTCAPGSRACFPIQARSMTFGWAMKATPKRKRPNEMSPARLRMTHCLPGGDRSDALGSQLIGACEHPSGRRKPISGHRVEPRARRARRAMPAGASWKHVWRTATA